MGQPRARWEVQQTQLANLRGVLAVMRVYAFYSPPARAPKGDR